MSYKKTHIKRNGKNYIDKPAVSWCGRDLSFEFHFVDIDHAVLSLENQDTLDLCLHCWNKIVSLVRRESGKYRYF